MEKVVLLNADFSFLGIIDWQRAMKLMAKQKVEVVKHSSIVIKGFHDFVLPKILRLVKLIRTIYKNKVPFSKKNIFVRDGYVCQFCGTSKDLTVDHVLPQSRGGKSEWNNCTTACKTCNNAKGNKLCREAKMYPKRTPWQPTISEFLMIKMKRLKVDKLLKELFK
jgi:5-methylcytosine-specific restriction endonuclease McrA